MKSASKKTDYDYNSFFPSMLRNLMEIKKETQESVAKACGVQRQTIGQWMNGNTMPDILSLKKIAVHFGVSSDYLLGLAKDPTTETNLKAVCEYTGLSQAAIDQIRETKEINSDLVNAELLETLSKIIESPNFWKMHGAICEAKAHHKYLYPNVVYFDEASKTAKEKGAFPTNKRDEIVTTLAMTGLYPFFKMEVLDHATDLFNEVVGYEKS